MINSELLMVADRGEVSKYQRYRIRKIFLFGILALFCTFVGSFYLIKGPIDVAVLFLLSGIPFYLFLFINANKFMVLPMELYHEAFSIPVVSYKEYREKTQRIVSREEVDFVEVDMYRGIQWVTLALKDGSRYSFDEKCTGRTLFNSFLQLIEEWGILYNMDKEGLKK